MMHHFSGWLSSGIHPDSANELLQKMSVHGGGANHAIGCKILEHFAISYRGKNVDHYYDEKTKCFSIIIGRPVWKNHELSIFSEQQGHAQTLGLAYAKYQTKLLNFLYGNFAALTYDNINNTLLIAVDRMGTHPIYYAQPGNNAFVFGTTATGITEFPSTTTELDQQSLYDYLFFHIVPSPNSIFKNQRKLLAAQFALFKNDVLQIDTYWKPDFSEIISEPTSQEKSNIINLLTNNIKLNLPNDNYGCFLSGGVDSSTVTALLSQITDSPVNTFSIGFDEAGYNELEYANIVARQFNTHHHEYYVTPADVVNAIPLIAGAYDEPFGNSSAVPVYYCAKLAHDNGVDTLFAGDAGDELFAGNERYAKQRVFEYYYLAPKLIRNVLELAFVNSIKIPKPFSKIQSYITQAKIPLPDRLQWYNYLKQTSSAELISDELLSDIDTENPFNLMREVYNKNSSASTLNKMLYLDWQFTLADNDIRKVSNMCAATNIEALYPFLGDDIVEYSCRLKSSTKLSKSHLRYFFKKSVEDLLPVEVLKKSKHGFGLPFGIWMRNYKPLQELAYDSIASMRNRNYIKPQYLDKLLHLHQTEHAAYYGEFIWVIMMLELWLQHHKF